MGKMTKGFNYIIGAIRAVVSAFFATIFILILFPTISGLAGVLTFGIWMIFATDFYILVLMLMAITGISTIISKIVIPDLPQGE